MIEARELNVSSLALIKELHASTCLNTLLNVFISSLNSAAAVMILLVRVFALPVDGLVFESRSPQT